MLNRCTSRVLVLEAVIWAGAGRIKFFVFPEMLALAGKGYGFGQLGKKFQQRKIILEVSRQPAFCVGVSYFFSSQIRGVLSEPFCRPPQNVGFLKSKHSFYL